MGRHMTAAASCSPLMRNVAKPRVAHKDARHEDLDKNGITVRKPARSWRNGASVVVKRASTSSNTSGPKATLIGALAKGRGNNDRLSSPCTCCGG